MRAVGAFVTVMCLVGCVEGPVYAREDLPAIVVTPSEGLPGTGLERRGAVSLAELAQYLSGLEEAGFVAAYETSLGHEDVLSGEVKQASLPGKEVRGVQSTAILFETADGAETVLRLGREDVANGLFDLERWLSADGLGEDGFGARAHSANDITATLFEWSRGNLLLFLNAYGEFTVPQVRDLAETMDRRAEETLLS